MEIRIGLLWLPVALAACGSGPSMPAAMSAAELRAAPTEVRQGDARWTLQAEGWRSFQPIAAAGGDPLIVVTRLASTMIVGAEVRIQSVTLARGDDVWSGAATEESTRNPGAAIVEFVTRDGPPWSPGDSVDVVAHIADATGAPVLLRAPRFAIARVD